jgi:hypothetical protein
MLSSDFQHEMPGIALIALALWPLGTGIPFALLWATAVFLLDPAASFKRWNAPRGKAEPPAA